MSEHATSDQWNLNPSERTDGFECLAFHRGKWVHVKWSSNQNGWSLGYGAPFIRDGDRAFAHLPANTPDRTEGNRFFDWK